VSFSRSLIGNSRSTANVFVTVRYASRNSTADHHGVATASRMTYFNLLGHGRPPQGPYRPPTLSPARMTLSASATSIGVTDQGGTSEPRPRDADDMAESGRGLNTVATLATRWDWTGDTNGRTIIALFDEK
jgi:hypothetical protein